MSLPRAAVLVAVLVIGGSASPAAQERLELFTGVGEVRSLMEIDATVSGFGTVRGVVPTPQVKPERPFALAGGRYVAWAELGRIGLLDRRTRRVVTVSLPETVGVAIELVADRRQPRLFVLAASTVLARSVWVIDARAPEPRLLFTTAEIVLGMAHAAVADLLFVNVVAFPGVHTTEVIDVATATPVRRLRLADWLEEIQVSDDGRWLWGLATLLTTGWIKAYDGHTGALLVTGPLVTGPLALDTHRGWLIVPDGEGEYLLQLDPLTFAERWRSRLDLPSGQRGHAATNLALSGRWMTGAYVVHTENRLDNVCQRIDLAAFDPDGTRRATAHLLPFAGATGSSCFATGVLVRSPLAPAALAGTASGSTVTLDWEDPGDTTAFEVEYGFAPGQRVGVLRVGPTSQLAIPGVPPGTYYVRVRGRNEVGGSPPSNEVRVVVQ